MNSEELITSEEDPQINPQEEWDYKTKEFETYFEDSKPGSAKVMALNDYIDLGYSETKVVDSLTLLIQLNNDPDDDDRLTHFQSRETYESQVRMSEALHIAGMTQFNQRKSTVPGYFYHFSMIQDSAEELNAYLADINKGKDEHDIEFASANEFISKVLENILLTEE